MTNDYIKPQVRYVDVSGIKVDNCIILITATHLLAHRAVGPEHP